MGKTRLEAFSDGVIAILITIMVLELKVPHGDSWHAIAPLAPVFCSYVLSFIYVGIYWNNHHHMLHATHKVSAAILWANLHLLFWLSLIPVTTGWMGENHAASLPAALYGGVLAMAGLAYTLLQTAIIHSQGRDSLLHKAVGNDWKGRASLALYIVAITLSFYAVWIAQVLYALIAMMWFIPDRRIERVMHENSRE